MTDTLSFHELPPNHDFFRDRFAAQHAVEIAQAKGLKPAQVQAEANQIAEQLFPGIESTYASVLCRSAEMVGFMSWSNRPDLIHLNYIEILDPFRRQGLGTAFLSQWTCQVRREYPKKSIALYVSKANPYAQFIYTKIGFVVTGVQMLLANEDYDDRSTSGEVMGSD